MRQKVVMVMGVQRSGTNALFSSFETDTSYRAFNESDCSEVFLAWNLRPEPEIRGLLGEPGPVLLKPVNETDFREVVDVLAEYAAYDVWIPWIYRDPVNVHASWWAKWRTPRLDEFIEMWCRRNRSILEAIPSFGSRIGIVRYEDLVSQPRVFKQACDFFGITGRYQFRADSRTGRQSLPAPVVAELERRTAGVLARLDSNRRFRA